VAEYEIDAVARFTIFGEAEIVVLVECKHHKHPIKREALMVLMPKERD
jgi:restriction system protein